MKRHILLFCTLAIIALAITVHLYQVQTFKSRILARVASIEANTLVSLSAGEARQFLTFLHTDRLKAGRKLSPTETQLLHRLITTLQTHIFFLTESQNGACLLLETRSRQAIAQLNEPASVLTSPDREVFLLNKARLESKIRATTANEWEVKDYKNLYQSQPPPPSDKFYNPILAAAETNRMIQDLCTKIRLSL